MERIASFTVDHNKLVPGLYLSRRDGDIVTLDLRFKKPNTGDLLSNSEMHSVEHLIATLLRNSGCKDAVIYFGPMGCQTGFYFLFDGRRLSLEGAVELLKQVFAAASEFEGGMPGKSPAECGNYVNLDVETGKAACRFYAGLIADWTVEKLAY
ncbi:MAG: S-ribosylhomocysteine lyase [Oscillospiraceae bacterium]|nr:S-ribosylhomocysteine lyase [Oscillospiraceae bacterium]